MGLRDRLTPRQVGLFKLAVWTVLLVWMVFFAIFSIAAANFLARLVPPLWGVGVWGQVMYRVLPAWYVFTSLLIILGIARYANRKLKG